MRTPVWLWPNLLSLDAPVVAVVWQDFLTRCYPSTLHPAGRCALGLTVWAIYWADRLIDVRHPAGDAETSRHRFYREHWPLMASVLAAVVCADVAVAGLWLRPAVLENGMWVGRAMAFYLGAFTLFQISRGRWKQCCATLLFTTGVFLVAWTSIPLAVDVLLVSAVAFGGLVLGNLMLVENWEQGRVAVWGQVPVWILMAALALIWWGDSRWYVAIALSAAGLTALAVLGKRLPGGLRHVLADAVLLTPLLLFFL